MSDEAPRLIKRAYRVRLYPTAAQARMLRRILGARRFIWNWALRRKREAWLADGTRLNQNALSAEFTQLKRQPETDWLLSLPRVPLAQTLGDFNEAWENFFAGRAARPRRKKRGAVKRMRFTLDQRREQVDRTAGRVQLDRVGKVRFKVSEPLLGRLRSVTVELDSAGRWHGSFTADQVPAAAAVVPARRAALGVDLGLKDAAVLSTGEVIAAPKALGQKLARLRRYQRHYNRQRAAAIQRAGLDPKAPIPKGTRFARPGDRRPPPANGARVVELSRRSQRTQAQIGRLHAEVADQRREFQHQLTRKLVDYAGVICIEDLSLKAMSRSMGRRAFRRSVADAGLAETRRQVTYKADWAGRTVSVVDRYYPSSKTCSACGEVNASLQLKDRRWACPACGTQHHRDVNAAVNLEREGLRLIADPSTAGRAGVEARREDACAAGSAPPAGQPTSTTETRELVYRRERGSRPRRGLDPQRGRAG